MGIRVDSEKQPLMELVFRECCFWSFIGIEASKIIFPKLVTCSSILCRSSLDNAPGVCWDTPPFEKHCSRACSIVKSDFEKDLTFEKLWSSELQGVAGKVFGSV